MLKHLGMFSCLVSAPWIAIGGIVELCLGNGVMEVIALELCALTLAILAAALVFDDVAGLRS